MTRRACTLLLAWLAAASASAEEPQSFTLTTDTPQYCAQLEKQVTERHSQLPEVQRLLSEGTAMCARGEVRGGIRHLRRALFMLHHHHPVKDGAKEPGARQAPPPKQQPAPLPPATPLPAPATTPK